MMYLVFHFSSFSCRFPKLIKVLMFWFIRRKAQRIFAGCVLYVSGLISITGLSPLLYFLSISTIRSLNHGLNHNLTKTPAFHKSRSVLVMLWSSLSTFCQSLMIASLWKSTQTLFRLSKNTASTVMRLATNQALASDCAFLLRLSAIACSVLDPSFVVVVCDCHCVLVVLFVAVWNTEFSSLAYVCSALISSYQNAM